MKLYLLWIEDAHRMYWIERGRHKGDEFCFTPV